MRTGAPNIIENEHVVPEQVAEKERAALRAETDASLAKQAAVSKKQAARRKAAAAEEQQKIAARPWGTKLKLRPRLVSRRGRLQSRKARSKR